MSTMVEEEHLITNDSTVISYDAIDQGTNDASKRFNDDGKPERSMCEIAGIFSFCFTNGTLLSTYATATLPTEANRIDAEFKSIILGGMLAIAGITQLSAPVAGLYSDRCTHRWGKRRPFILAGGVCGAAGLALQWLGSREELWALWVVAFTVSMLALNVIFSAVIGLVPDLIHSSQMGRANGIIASLSTLGALLGYGVWFAISGDTRWMYIYYLALLCSSIMMTLFCVRETPITSHCEAVRWEEVKASFWVSPHEHYDFFVVFVSRTFYYMGLSVMAFFLYYLKDMIDAEHPQQTLSLVAVCGLACGSCCAFPAGFLSDYLDNGRKIYIYVSCTGMAMGCIGLIFCHSLEPVYPLLCFIGALEGIYLTMDYAIAIDTLPNQEEAARFMGVWGVASFIGAALGPAIGGPALYLIGHTSEPGHYSEQGYAVLWILSALYLLIGAYIISYVRSVR